VLARQAAAKTRAVSGRVHDHAVVTPPIGLAAAREECGTDAWVLIEEPEICSALRFMIDTEHQLIEGAAAVAIAASLKAGRSSGGQAMVIVSCGANISSTLLAEAIASASAS
jgi:threonine dehydratase